MSDDGGAGTIEWRVPKLRHCRYVAAFLEPRRLANKALAVLMRESLVQGVSTRLADELLRSFGMSGISENALSRLRGSNLVI
jgi:transposase-like protein